MVNFAPELSQPRGVNIVIDSYWRIEKNIPLTLLGALLIQTFGAIWWASSVSHRLDDQDRRIRDIVQVSRTVALEQSQNIQRLAKSEQSLLDIRDSLNRIDNKLSQVVENGSRK